MTGWLRHQRRAMAGAVRRLMRTPLISMTSVLVIGIALSLPVALYLALDNLNRLAGHLHAEPQLSLYLALDTSPAEVRDTESRLKAHAGVARYRFVAREDAFNEMKASSGLADLLDGLERNPLPHAFIVRANNAEPEALDNLRAEIEKWPKAEHVLLDSAWARKLATLSSVGEKIVLMLALVLGAALVAITGNTIRLQILTQRDEIEVGKLFGATDAFIRRPYLFFGALQGLLGGICALAAVAGAWSWLSGSVTDLLKLYAAEFLPHAYHPAVAAAVIGGSSFLGWLGAYLSVSLYLREIKPR